MFSSSGISIPLISNPEYPFPIPVSWFRYRFVSPQSQPHNKQFLPASSLAQPNNDSISAGTADRQFNSTPIQFLSSCLVLPCLAFSTSFLPSYLVRPRYTGELEDWTRRLDWTRPNHQLFQISERVLAYLPVDFRRTVRELCFG